MAETFKIITNGVTDVDELWRYARHLEAVRRGEGWQPIETAPRDQRSILAVNANSQIQQVSWRKDIDSELYVVRFGGEWKPTHWQLLPEPPK